VHLHAGHSERGAQQSHVFAPALELQPALALPTSAQPGRERASETRKREEKGEKEREREREREKKTRELR
jgi:hypothetical protein